ncbi:MAG TPA: hypothetical protein VHY35_24265 [Stellaceae bacterium]|nr:hypothetical protein [Stellaceae bacterium]
MVRSSLIGAAVLAIAAATTAMPAQAQRWQPELGRLHALCNQGYRPACIRFGVILGRNQERNAEWRRLHPDWYYWEPWVPR